MNKIECERKIELMKPEMLVGIQKECSRLLNSGCLDLEKYEMDDFGIAKVVLTVALENLADQYYPFSRSLKEEVRNLRKF